MTTFKTTTQGYVRMKKATLSLIAEIPLPPVGVARILGIHEAFAGKITRQLHQQKASHISGWSRKDTIKVAYAPIYSAGEGMDATHPGRMSLKEREKIID